ncbi:Bromodomain-containing protein [Crucibulum laeve]|uniref:histone acetyltransferase n=1 Tax=Crucibulum laeve TaxID=68775 RepID=A0A5C3MG52_9AGAR|nr:Bromodomain-containing protein [Crucibulum laeve]
MTVGTSSKSRPPVGKRSGKKAPGKKSKKAHTAPTSLAPPVGEKQAQMNGKINTNGYETKVKVEDKMDEGQLTRLAAGVTVDSGARSSAGPPTRTEKAGPAELRKGVIQVIAVENDGQPRSFVVLTGLKALFQKQLPKMPREYIARLVYDCNSKALAIVKRGYKAVGGICYRPFPHRGFAEIVFFATNSVYQDKGYGGMLMDYFKAHIKKIYPDMMYFLTYADNYAVGYFEKQGFSKDITLDRSVWAGYIKDYEGGTIMQCTMVRKVDYPEKAKIVAAQQEAIMTKIREMSKSHIVHPGLPQFQEGAPEGVTVDPKNVPGLRESGWTPEMTANPIRPGPRGADFRFMDRALRDLKVYSQSWPFLTPVNGEDVPDYYDVVKNPMDFSTMEDKLGAKRYDSVEAFAADVQLIIDNCRLYNPETTIYTKCANKLEKYFKEMLEDRFKRDD